MEEFTGSSIKVVYKNRHGWTNIVHGSVERCTLTLVILIDHEGKEHRIRKSRIKETIIFVP